MFDRSLEESISRLLEEDDLSRNSFYAHSLPEGTVEGELHLKSNLRLAGLPFFCEVFRFLGAREADFSELEKFEGKDFAAGDVLRSPPLSFNVALTGERLALNLLQRATSIATTTSHYVEKAKKHNIAILDTRKTTPGLRFFEKYATRVGGAYNHRLGQSDLWMVKDNHKTYFGGLEEAVAFFRSQGSFYTPLLAEIHNLGEIDEARKLGIRHLLLDNFSPEEVKSAVEKKREGMTYEVSGGIRLENIENYFVQGIDAISVGALTNAPDIVDISFKYSPKR